MSDVGGIRAPIPTQQTQQAAPAQQAQQAAPAQQARPTKEAFAQTKAQMKLPVTTTNALTQLKSQDQMALMKMSQEHTIGKLSENLKNAKSALKTDILPKAIIGAGQSIPPATMRAMVAVRGSLFAGRAFEVSIGRESSALSFRIGGKSFNVTMMTKLKRSAKKQEHVEDEDDELEEDL